MERNHDGGKQRRVTPPPTAEQRAQAVARMERNVAGFP